MARPGVAALVDVVNAHAYYETWNGLPTETLPRYVQAFAPSLAPSRPLWLAEIGYSSHRRGAQVSADYRARFDYEHTPEFQAVVLIRTVTLALTRPEVQLVAWYELKDAPESAPVIGDENNRHLGVATATWQPKPALAALALAARLFGPGIVRLDDHLRVARPPASRAEVHAFLTAEGHAVIVGWLPTVVPDAPPGGGDAVDTRVERLSIELPLVPAGPGRSLDATGRERSVGPEVRVGEGSLRFGAEIRGGDVALFDVPAKLR
jgi:hypothetical protein